VPIKWEELGYMASDVRSRLMTSAQNRMKVYVTADALCLSINYMKINIIKHPSTIISVSHSNDSFV
jgi:hypothetical protein